MTKSEAIEILVSCLIGIQEDLPDEDDRDAIGKAVHFLREYATALTNGE